MHPTSLSHDQAEIYLSQLCTDHSRAKARSAFRTIAVALGVESTD